MATRSKYGEGGGLMPPQETQSNSIPPLPPGYSLVDGGGSAPSIPPLPAGYQLVTGGGGRAAPSNDFPMPQHGPYGPVDVTRPAPGAQATGNIRAARTSDYPWYERPSMWLGGASQALNQDAENANLAALRNAARGGSRLGTLGLEAAGAISHTAGDVLGLGSTVATPKGAAITAASAIPGVGKVVGPAAAAYFGGSGALNLLSQKQPNETGEQFIKRVGADPDMLQQALLSSSLLVAAATPAARGVENMRDLRAVGQKMDTAGKLVSSADRMGNIIQGMLGAYKERLVPILAQARQAIWAPENDSWETVKSLAHQAGDPFVNSTNAQAVDIAGASNEAKAFIKKRIFGSHNIESWTTAKNDIFDRFQTAEGADRHYLGEVYKAMLDDAEDYGKDIGASKAFANAKTHSMARFDFEDDLVSKILKNQSPLRGEHIGLLKQLVGEKGAAAESIATQMERLSQNYPQMGSLADAFRRYTDYTKNLQDVLNTTKSGFMGMFRSMMKHPLLSSTAWLTLNHAPWIFKLMSINELGRLADYSQAGSILRQLRADIPGKGFLEDYSLGTSARDIPPPSGRRMGTPPNPRFPGAGQSGSPASPDVSRGPVTPAERAEWATQSPKQQLAVKAAGVRNAKPVGADVAGGEIVGPEPQSHVAPPSGKLYPYEGRRVQLQDGRTGKVVVGLAGKKARIRLDNPPVGRSAIIEVPRSEVAGPVVESGEGATYGSSAEMHAGLARALGEEGTPEAIEAKRAEAAKRARRRGK